jgi:PAP2 superfamily
MVRPDLSRFISSTVSPSATSRRRFLSAVGEVGAAGMAAKLFAFLPEPKAPQSAEAESATDRQRVNQAFHVRRRAALYQRELPLPDHPDNGDDDLYQNRIGSYTKGLPHNQLGEVDNEAYRALIRALQTGNPDDFDRVPKGGTVKQVNPQAALAFVLEGPDSHHLGMAAPPAFSSARTAGEMVELYWQALTRDVPFSEYDSYPLTAAAAADLSNLSDFHGPKAGGQVTPATLFRGDTAGDLVGPYISQFLWKNVPYGATPIVQKIQTTSPSVDYLISYPDWLAIQDGVATEPAQIDPTPRYVRNNRDLAEYVHRDFTYQHFLNACLILLGFGVMALDDGNPYIKSPVQAGFSTFGGPHVLDAVAKAANYGLIATWYQKWLVHRRLRPEEFGGRVHNHQTRAACYPLHQDVLNSAALDAVFGRYGGYLLPMAYAEGCPTHPAYPAGHAVIAGACATVLKAFFNESFVIPDPVQASADGLSLSSYTGSDLTVGGELNKLASNVAIGRDAAGVHWRSDGIEGLKLGEAVAIGVLTDMKACYNERFAGFSLTRFDGRTITV